MTAISRSTFAPVPASTALARCQAAGRRRRRAGRGGGRARACLVDPAVVACGAPHRSSSSRARESCGPTRASCSPTGQRARSCATRQGRPARRRKTIRQAPARTATCSRSADRLYVPIRRGLAVVDLTGKAKPSVDRAARRARPRSGSRRPAASSRRCRRATGSRSSTSPAAARAPHRPGRQAARRASPGWAARSTSRTPPSRTVTPLSAASGSAIGRAAPVRVLRGARSCRRRSRRASRTRPSRPASSSRSRSPGRRWRAAT